MLTTAMARPTLMHANTVMPAKIKRETTINELLRRLLNTIRGLPNSEEDMVATVDRFMVEMRNSGYSERYRRDTIVNTMCGYRRRIVEDEERRRPLYREAHIGARERNMSRITAAAKWFKRRRDSLEEEQEDTTGRIPVRRNPWRKGKPKVIQKDTREIEGVVFIPHTFDSDLQRLLQKTDDKVTSALKMPRTK